MGRARALGATLLGLALTGVVLAEIQHRRASTSDLGSPPAAGARREVIVVLGYPCTRRGRLHPMQKWRTLIALRSGTPGRETSFVFSGGARPGGPSEAMMMGGYAESLGVPVSRIILEDQAETTWENIANSIPALEDAEVIKIASDPMHARRARRYLFDQRPDLAARLAPAEDYRPGEWWIVKPLLLVYEWAAMRRGQRGD